MSLSAQCNVVEGGYEYFCGLLHINDKEEKLMPLQTNLCKNSLAGDPFAGEFSSLLKLSLSTAFVTTFKFGGQDAI